MIKRIIGIDFGTSTSLIKIKNYAEEEPADQNPSSSQYVEFDGLAMVPTLIRVQEGSFYYGYDAQPERENSLLYSNFKMDLESPDMEKQEKAKDLTRKFLRYLYGHYVQQEMYFGKYDEVQTILSYPAKWKEETREFMLEAAGESGFPKVKGMEEPTAALYAALVQERQRFESWEGFFQGKPLNMLMIDMGAGTTDLALCRYKPGESNEILLTWPEAQSRLFFGGNEMDGILNGYLCSYLEENPIPPTVIENFAEKNRENCKAWKEDIVSKLLKEDKEVTSCPFISGIFQLWNIIPTPFPPLGRKTLEETAEDYLKVFARLIQGILKQGIEKGILKNEEEIDFILLTGGHSQWYFVEDILMDRIPSCPPLGLKNIQKHPKRLLKMSRPQETVGCGLVYSVQSIQVRRNVRRTDSKKADSIKDFSQDLAQRAQKGDREAQYFLGKAYQAGEQVMYNPAAALYWWREAAQMGHLDAMWEYGRALILEGNREEGIQWIFYSAEEGQTDAEVYLAYQEETYEKRRFWSRKLLEEKGPDMETRYVTGYFQQEGKLRELYRPGRYVFCELENFMGESLFYGLGVERDYKKAFAYFEAAAKDLSDIYNTGARQAGLNLVMCYQWGKGVSPDPLRARSICGFLQTSLQFPTIGSMVEAWTLPQERKPAFLEEREFRELFCSRFPGALGQIPRPLLQQLSRIYSFQEPGEQVYLLQMTHRREQLVGRPFTLYTVLTDRKAFSLMINDTGGVYMKWYFRYEEAGEYYVEGGFMKAIAVRLKPGRREKNLLVSESGTIATGIRETSWLTALQWLTERDEWKHKRGKYRIRQEVKNE